MIRVERELLRVRPRTFHAEFHIGSSAIEDDRRRGFLRALHIPLVAHRSAVRPKFQIARNVCCALRRLNFGVAARDPIAPIRAE